MSKEKKSSVLIIGSGLAGLSLALKLTPRFHVVLVTKREALETATRYAQGGIASVTAATDNFESHIQDTLTAGAGLCRPEIVDKVVREGPTLVKWLVAQGVQFSKKAGEEFDLGMEGGHSQRRVLHAGDITGLELEQSLLKQVRANPDVEILENHVAIDLLSTRRMGLAGPNTCLGAYVLDTKQNEVITLTAHATVLATGGAGKVYLYTSNPDIATGDGMAMAYRAGATVSNLEFVQFHPTCLYNPGGFAPGRGKAGRTFLISEAVRGEGAILRLSDGTPFMEKYHPLKELAPRDIVARAIDFEMKKRGDEFVWLDISHQKASFIKERFPNIYDTCLQSGYDMATSPIPVVPAAHYFCGGVAATVEGQTDVARLYAIGETACTGLHGANRLASNSLLEALAMGHDAAHSIDKNFSDSELPVAKVRPWDPGQAHASDEAVVITQNWDEIRRLLWNYVGIVRSNKRLERARRRIQILKEEIRDYYWNVTVSRDLIELRNIVCIAELVIESAMNRHESRGLHYNIDYPLPVESEKKDTRFQKSL